MIVVYNTASGFAGTVQEVALRACTPDDHPCRLTWLTRTPFGVRRRWRRFLATFGLPVEYLHLDQFTARYAMSEVDAPAVYTRGDGGVRAWIASGRIRACRSLDDLERLMRTVSEPDA